MRPRQVWPNVKFKAVDIILFGVAVALAASAQTFFVMLAVG